MSRPVLVVLWVLSVTAGCAADPGPVCGPAEEVMESGSFHVLSGTPVEYELSPPTSGPHQSPAPTGGVATEPIPEPLQVGALEEGMVLLQYTEVLDDASRERLEELASERDGVIVAPAIRPLDGRAAVAFSAWGIRRLCGALDLDAARAFVDDHATAVPPAHTG